MIKIYTEQESNVLLQKIDCNCNDCAFMKRNVERFKLSQKKHLEWQKSYFESKKNKIISNAKIYKENNNIEMYNKLIKESEKLKFQFDKSSCSINYGYCEKFSKDVSFIPNTCQPDTRHCFKHRKDID